MSFVDCSYRETVSTSQLEYGLGAHVVSLLGLPETDVLRSHAQNIAIAVDDAGAGTAGADVDSEVVVHVWVQLVMGVSGHLTGGLPRGLSKRERHEEKSGPCFSG